MSILSLLIIVAISAAFIVRWKPKESGIKNKAVSNKFQKLWDDAYEAIKSNKFLKAERALLTILKSDEKNAAAYNRLGILYVKQKNYDDAIECFEIARSIEPSASSLHNLGLVYYELQDYARASEAFDIAIELEDNIAARYVAYAKVQLQLSKPGKVVSALERAAVLEPSIQTFRLLIDAYRSNDQPEQADVIEKKLTAITKSTKAKRTKLVSRIKRQPRRVVM